MAINKDIVHPEQAGFHVCFWRDPPRWFREQNLSRDYWIFFVAAFFYDAGFSVYFFLFNLYLLDFHYDERSIGWVSSAFLLGSLTGTLPAGEIARRLGVRTLLILCFLSAPLLGTLRILWIWEPAQIGLAFLAGIAMSSWGVAYLPTVARLTTQRNRATAFSLIFSVSIGTSALGGLVSGYLPQWLRSAGYNFDPSAIKRFILLGSCVLALMALAPALRLRMSATDQEPGLSESGWSARAWKLEPFLRRFLPCMALWSGALAAFAPFTNVYLVRGLHLPLLRVAFVFSAVQVVQFVMGLSTPAVLRLLGLRNGILAMQTTAAIALAALGAARIPALAIVLYLVFAAAQWMSSPALYNLLMNEVQDQQRDTAASVTLFTNALAGVGAAALAGVMITRFDYPRVMFGIAVVAFAAALLFRFLVAPQMRRSV